MAMGMSYDEYWYGDIWRSKMYVKAYKIKERQEDYNAWLSGVYIAKAIEATICNAFRDKNSQKEQYPNRPLSFYEEGLEELEELDEQAKEEKEKKQKEQEILKAKLYMQNMVTAGKNWGKKR